MRIEKGERWVVTCPESKNLEVEFLEEVFTHVDEHVLVRITGGERVYASSSKRPEKVGDLTMLRTITTVFRRQVAEAQHG